MLTRTTLNARQPRTLRDTGRDPWDWCEHAYSQPRLLRWWRPVANVLFVCACSSALAWIAFYGLSGGFR